MGRITWGGIRLEEGRVFSLAYADDLVVMAEEENEMKSMIERLEGLLGQKEVGSECE